MNAVDLLSPSDGAFPARMSVGEELANRYLILLVFIRPYALTVTDLLSTHYSFQGFKARIGSSAALQKLFTQQNVAEFSDFLSLVHDWRAQKIGNLEMRLSAMRMMPFFFAGMPADAKFYDIDASPMVECLKTLTATMLFVNDGDAVYDPNWVWIEGSESKLLYETVKAHFASLSESQDDASETRLSTSWSSMCVATGLYLHSVLGISGDTLEPRVFRRFLSLLLRDVDRNVYRVRYSTLSDLWFWKTFLGAYSIAKLQTREDVGDFERGFDRLIGTWSRACGIKQWEDARARLGNITWPWGQSQDLAEEVWNKATRW